MSTPTVEVLGNKYTISEELLNKTQLPDIDVKLIQCDRVELTMERAREYLDYPQFEGERVPKQKDITRLVNEVKNGLLVGALVNIILVKLPDGTIIRENGQHICIVKLLLEYWKPIVNWMVFSVKSDSDLRKLYNVIDNATARSYPHKIKASLCGVEEFKGISDEWMRIFSTATKLFKNDKDLYIAELTVLMKTELESLINKTYTLLTGENEIRQYLKRGAVVAAVMSTINKSLPKSREFWARIVDGAGFTGDTDPKNKLRTYLMTHTLSDRNRSNRKVKNVSETTMFHFCAQAWNAFRDVKTLSRFNPDCKGWPKFK